MIVSKTFDNFSSSTKSTLLTIIVLHMQPVDEEPAANRNNQEKLQVSKTQTEPCNQTFVLGEIPSKICDIRPGPQVRMPQ